MKVVVVVAGATAAGGRAGDGDADEPLSATTLATDLESALDSDLGVEIEAVDGTYGESRTVPIVEADLIVAVGEQSLLTLVRDEVVSPILPVAIEQGVESVAHADLESAIRSFVAEDHSTKSIPTIHVQADGDEFRALMDVMAVTADAAKISEYRLLGRDRGEEVAIDTVRADGIVASAPAGTPGYGTAAGGPILDPDLQAVNVIPVGPFRVEQPHWVLELPISIEVARGEVPVTLLVDDRDEGRIQAGTTVELTWGDPVDIVRTPVSASSLGESRRAPDSE